MKKCVKCGKSFVSKYNQQECCSVKCSRELRKERGWFWRTPSFYASKKGCVCRSASRFKSLGKIRQEVCDKPPGMSWKGISYSSKKEWVD